MLQTFMLQTDFYHLMITDVKYDWLLLLITVSQLALHMYGGGT